MFKGRVGITRGVIWVAAAGLAAGGRLLPGLPAVPVSLKIVTELGHSPWYRTAVNVKRGGWLWRD